MKTKIIYLAVFLAGFLIWSCNKSATNTTPAVPTVTLKAALTQGVQNLTTAVNSISTSTGYQVVTGPADLVTKSVELTPLDTASHSILLANIAGVYDYKATFVKIGRFSFISRFFNKTGDSTLMVVRLPQSKVANSRTLLKYSPSDTLLANDYVITLSDYDFTYRLRGGYDYRMASSTAIQGVAAGTYKIQSSHNHTTNSHFSAEYDFPNGYITKITYAPGDTAVSDYSISDGKNVLYEEKYTSIRSDSLQQRRETNYSLTIGNVEIVRQLGQGKSNLDSAKVYVGGVLESKAKVSVVTNTTGTVDNTVTSKKRDLLITFDDGTTATISSLASAAIPTLSAMFTSLHQANFATAIVDWIAWEVYYTKP